MDFSSDNPTTTNALNLAARRNDVENVRRLLKKINPNCVDDRGWTCLHEAASNDSYKSLLLILDHPLCRPSVETHEGHTALYLACRERGTSLKTIKKLLETDGGNVNYFGTEGLTPLHVASTNGRVELIQLLLENGAVIDPRDYDGDTPLHAACLRSKPEAVKALLQAGADPLIQNEQLFTPFHLACCSSSLEAVRLLLPFMKDVNQKIISGDTPLMVTLHSQNELILDFLLENGADPNLKNNKKELALDIAMVNGYSEAFTKLLAVTDTEQIDENIVCRVFKPHYFTLDILGALLTSNLGPKFFDFKRPVEAAVESIREVKLEYQFHAPLNVFLDVVDYIYKISPTVFREFYNLFLVRGVSVNAQKDEFPPLAYINHCNHTSCFEEVFELFMKHGCNIDHCSNGASQYMPDAFIASVTSGGSTAPFMFPFSLYCDPGVFIEVAFNNDFLDLIPEQIQRKLVSMIDSNCDLTAREHRAIRCVPLKHLSRLKVRDIIKQTGNGEQKTTQEFLEILNNLPLPHMIKNYLQFIE